MYYARVAQAFSASIKCPHCKYTLLRTACEVLVVRNFDLSSLSLLYYGRDYPVVTGGGNWSTWKKINPKSLATFSHAPVVVENADID